MNDNLLTTNCCRFIEQNSSSLEALQILHFIRETKQSTLKNWKTVAYYQLCYVFSGEATLRIAEYSFLLKQGSLFLLFPGMSYMLDAQSNFVYTYIGFLGKRANQFTDKYKLSASNCVFNNLSNLERIWIDGLAMESEMLALSAESVLLFSFASMGKNFCHIQNGKEVEHTKLKKIKFILAKSSAIYLSKYSSTIFSSCF